MASKIFLISVILCIGACRAQVAWPDLRIKYDLNAFGGFHHMGRTLNDVRDENNFVEDPDQKTCIGELDNGAFYYGFRASDPNEAVLSLLYDIQGTIAGVQAWFPKEDVLKNPETNTVRFDLLWSYQNKTLNGKEFFVSTAYFVRPETICTTGRPESSLDTEGTGYGLWLQSGPSPLDNQEVPLKRSDAYPKGWSKNSCFPGMGRHNFYQVDTYDATNCTETEGYFLLYNKQEELTGFGFRNQGLTNSRYIEHPPNLAISAILGDPVPQCVLDENTLHGTTTMHVFFTSQPWQIVCV